jgi:hypothetical protein
MNPSLREFDRRSQLTQPDSDESGLKRTFAQGWWRKHAKIGHLADFCAHLVANVRISPTLVARASYLANLEIKGSTGIRNSLGRASWPS